MPAVSVAAGLRQIVGQGSDMVIFLLFGINDYNESIPVSGEDPYATDTYMGAMRTGIEKLQSMFTDCQLVLVTPNFIKYNNFGTNPVGEEGNVFVDYVNAVRELGDEYALPVLDFYKELGIEENNFVEYLQDEIHPNETGRFNMGMCVLKLLREMFA